MAGQPVGENTKMENQDPNTTVNSDTPTPGAKPKIRKPDTPHNVTSPPLTQKISSPSNQGPSWSPAEEASLPALAPSSSAIFERDVQESNIPDDASVHIPNHIQTEDHIPPVLEASSLAITNDKIAPTEVSIITHTAHHPAKDKAYYHGGKRGTLTPSPIDMGTISPLGLSPVEDFGAHLRQHLENTQAQGASQHPNSTGLAGSSGETSK
jgi:hypothetical protein